MNTSSRLFLAISVPEIIRDKLDELRCVLPGTRWITSSNLHLTLQFIGEVEPDRIEEIKQTLQEVSGRSFLVAFKGAGYFPSRGNPKVLWAGCEQIHPHLLQLLKKSEG
tara:strand:+ start:949 stop:1275 length:327 start_codon:yes stop_codon:yes gene_type:complete